MAPSRLKTHAFHVLYAGIVLLLLSPLYMYFSHDVEILRHQYPHSIEQNQDISFVIKEGKPKHWVSLKQISRFARWAIILSEDWSFYHHQGIDLAQIKIAIRGILTAEKFRGASTITQQMVKNIFLSDERTIWRKVHEIILAQKVEKVLTKDRILEIYFNCIEFGPGIYGIREASYHYFKKHPSALNPKEGAFLAMLLPSPKRYYVSFKKKELTPFARSRINTILQKMKMVKVISPLEYVLQKSTRLSWEN